MTEETKKLFNAPWQVKTYDCFRLGYEYCVEASNGDTISISKDENPDAEKHAKRIKHLPELYEALKEAVDDACGTCAMMQVDSNSYDFVKNGCPFFEDHDDCLPIKWIDILRKVRDGK